MFLPGWLSNLKRRTRANKQTGNRRRNQLSKFGMPDWRLEDRCVPVGRVSPMMLQQVMPGIIRPPIVVPPVPPTPPPVTPPGSGGGGLGGSFTFVDPPMPLATVTPGNDISKVLFVGNSTVGMVPTKTFTVINNSDQTIYPFLYNANNGFTGGIPYDPFDTPHQTEWREYIGYIKDSIMYMGLRAHTSIQMTVPLVFWDSGRMAIATDPTSMLPRTNGQINFNTNKNTPNVDNPTHFEYFNTDGTQTDRAIVTGIVVTNLQTNRTSTDGILMYYHCKDLAEDPGIDAPDQLIEYTIRDKEFLTKIGIPESSGQLKTLINYDVSYVDHLLAPIAMSGLQVPITDGAGNILGREDFGWIGAENAYLNGPNNLQGIIANFVSNNPALNGLGTYFNGNGWPTFFNPNYNAQTSPGVGIRIPGGANIFFDSPLAGRVSSFSTPFGATNHWMLSSGGNQPIRFSQTGAVQTDTSKIILGVPADFLTLVKPGWIVTSNELGPTKPFGIVLSVDPTSRTVTMTGPAQNLIPDKTIYSIILSSPLSDPYAERLRAIWYSWSEYYRKLFVSFPDTNVDGIVKKDNDSVAGVVDDLRILQFTTAQTDLRMGMQLTKIKINGNETAITPLITILKISDDKKTIYLSQPIPGTQDNQAITATFSKPPAINTFGDTITGLFDIDNTKFGDFPGGLAGANQFAGNVYEVLSVFSTVNPRQVPQLPGSMELLGNSIGGNVGFLPTAKYGPVDKPVALKNISADIRDVLKSALRGVPDFATYAEALWYPDPAQGTGDRAGMGTGGQSYNIFNLDPFVWFVHKKAKLSGYGFSFDDDSADVGANLTSTLGIAFGGLFGLTNHSEYGGSTHWGEKTSLVTITDINFPDTDPLHIYNGLSMMTVQNTVVYNQVTPDDLANALVGAYVSGTGIPTTGMPVRLKAFGLLNRNQFVLSAHVPPTSVAFNATFSARPKATTVFFAR